MLKITYGQLLIFITLLWLIIRSSFWLRLKKSNPEKISVKAVLSKELLLLLVYICIIVIVRIVFFPWHHDADGRIGTLNFDPSRILPFRLNLIPIVRLTDVYEGWQMNIIGNLTMFIPVGLVWPLCFKKIDNFWKTLLAGGGFSLFIEISQLLFYDRCTDVDDLLLNTSGVVIGAAIYFIVKASCQKLKERQ